MPRTSPLTCNKILGNVFVMFVLSVIIFIYSNVINAYSSRREGDLYTEYKILVFLICFHLSVFMLIWCFLKAMLTDPGVVPPLWGFYMGDSENKRRRYCLMCHVFKPERCHHCSACNRCVLNMDHHCRNI
jgi:palmitoyltransferase ZDHHC2/15/20